MRANCASVSQKTSLTSPLSFRAVNHAAKQKSMHPDSKHGKTKVRVTIFASQALR